MLTQLNQAETLQRIRNIPDPEIPVITIADLGILREVVFGDTEVKVFITPTYNGCPAMKAIEKQITEVLHESGYDSVKVELVFSPAWTTDWLSDDAKERLRAYGIAPPLKATDDKNVLSPNPKKIHCPRCGSDKTTRVSAFGSTACKSLHKCNDCLEPFDYFKCH
jgi:ring-1,2-phenylacetyl-CoA epoxidase subunit PaaD